MVSEQFAANGSLELEDLNCSNEELTGRTSKNLRRLSLNIVVEYHRDVFEGKRVVTQRNVHLMLF